MYSSLPKSKTFCFVVVVSLQLVFTIKANEDLFFLDSTDFYCMDRRKEVKQVLEYILSFSLSMESMEGDFCDLEWKSSLMVFCLAISCEVPSKTKD